MLLNNLKIKMSKTIKNFLFLLIGIILLPFAICVCLCSLPFIVYICLIELFKVRGIEADDLWFINKWLESLINHLVELHIGNHLRDQIKIDDYVDNTK